ncbi:hypothetical protein EC968_007048 [Mortierella alpina]|nr:hypothetical protein EC968_007048 [Mortierella alpina]
MALRQLLAALETIYKVSSTNEARQQAQEFCEALKQDPSGPLYGYYLAHKDNQHPDVVRHFGLGLIENVVRYRWSDGSVSAETKTQIRLNVMSLAAEGSMPMLTEQAFIKEKIARLFVEVVKREWPGAWDDMDVFLRQLYFKDETAREMALLILRSLCEDVCIYDDAVAGLRKKDLRAGLLVIMASERVLKEQYPDGVKGHHNEITLMVGEPGNDGWISRLSLLLQELLPKCQNQMTTLADEKIALSALKTLASALDWVIATSLSTAAIVPLICQAMLSPSEKIRLAGAECYDVIASRNFSDAEREKIVWPMLDEGGIGMIADAYSAYSAQLLQGDAYLFIQKLVQATVNLGEQQLCAKRNAHVPKELSRFLQLLYSMTSHPSVLISSIVGFFWTTLLGHDTFSKNPTVHGLVPPLLELYSVHLAKGFENRRTVDPIYRHFAAVDFDSLTEFRARAGQAFQKAVDVIHYGVPIVPLDALLWVANKVSEALKSDFSGSENVKETAEFKEFDGTFTLLEVLGAMDALLQMILESEAKCPAAKDRIVGSLSAFTDMFKLNSTQLFRCLDKLFKAVEYPLPSTNASDVRELRRRAAITLVKIGRAIPDTLYPIYGEIESAVQQLIQRRMISMGEKKTMLSFLLVIGFNSAVDQEWRAIFEKVVMPVVADFQCAELQEALSSSAQFMVYIGANELSDACSKTLQPEEINKLKETIVGRRSTLSWSIDTLLTFMKETVDPKNPQKQDLWGYCLTSILPNLLSTIRCLNAINDESLWAGFSPDVGRILQMSPEEKEMMVTGKISDPTTGAAGLSVARLIAELKTWLSVAKDHSYRFLAQISILGTSFYSIPSLPTVLEQSLFGHVDNLTNRQLRFLINSCVQPLVINCPKEYMASVLSHLLMVLFPYLHQRLQKDWKLASEEGLVMDEKEDPEDRDVSDEIVTEMMLRDLTRYVSEFLFSILDYGKHKPTGEAPCIQTTSAHKEITPLALFVLSTDAIAQSVVPLICSIITFEDTRACMRAADTALCVLHALTQNYPGTRNIIGLFATVVLQAALQALHNPYHQEGHDKLILLITEVYVEVRAFDEAPKQVFRQALGAEAGRLETFERELSSTINKTKKHALVRNFLQGIIGIAKSEWFKQKEQGDKPTSIRTITGNYERPSQSVLDAERSEEIGEDLASVVRFNIPSYWRTSKRRHIPSVVRLANQLYNQRILELRLLIQKDEQRFRTLVAELDDIRQGKWDSQLEEELKKNSREAKSEAALNGAQDEPTEAGHYTLTAGNTEAAADVPPSASSPSPSTPVESRTDVKRNGVLAGASEDQLANEPQDVEMEDATESATQTTTAPHITSELPKEEQDIEMEESTRHASPPATTSQIEMPHKDDKEMETEEAVKEEAATLITSPQTSASDLSPPDALEAEDDITPEDESVPSTGKTDRSTETGKDDDDEEAVEDEDLMKEETEDEDQKKVPRVKGARAQAPSKANDSEREDNDEDADDAEQDEDTAQEGHSSGDDDDAVSTPRANRRPRKIKTTIPAKRKRRGGRGGTVGETEEGYNSSDSETTDSAHTNMSDQLMRTQMDDKKWKKILMMIWTDIANHRFGAVFMQPIKEQDAPGYYVMIKRPMDLKSIKERIRDGQITNADEFHRDVLLMFLNALMYNGEETEVYQMALAMMQEVEFIIKNFKSSQSFAPTASGPGGSGNTSVSTTPTTRTATGDSHQALAAGSSSTGHISRRRKSSGTEMTPVE